jgi:hypothetical protein
VGVAVHVLPLLFYRARPMVAHVSLLCATGLASCSQVIFQQLDPSPFSLGSTFRFHSPDGELSRSHSRPRLKAELRRVPFSAPMSTLGASNQSGFLR